jgi:hypothetical protein
MAALPAPNGVFCSGSSGGVVLIPVSLSSSAAAALPGRDQLT